MRLLLVLFFFNSSALKTSINQARSKKKRRGLVQTGSKQSEQTYSKLCEIQAMRLFVEAVRVLVEAVEVIVQG